MDRSVEPPVDRQVFGFKGEAGGGFLVELYADARPGRRSVARLTFRLT